MWKIIIILSVNVLLYARTLKYGYVSDDLPALGSKFPNRRMSIWSKLISVPTGNKYIDHGLNLFVHSLACVFIYIALGMNNISFVAALLFSCNPVNNQSSVWISGRQYAWCALCLMIAYVLPIVAPVTLLLSTVNPAGFFTPLGFIGTDKYYLAFLLPLLWAFRFKRLKTEVQHRRKEEAVDFDKKLSWQKILIAIKIYGYYFILCIVPFKLSWYHSFMQSGAGAGNELERKKALSLSWPFWVGITLIGYLIYSFWNWTPISWGVFWFSICIAPYCGLFRMSQEIAERYCYVANIGVMFALANTMPYIVIVFILGAYFSRLLTYIPAYSDDYWLIEKAVSEDPGAWYAWHLRAHKRWNQQSFREALNCWVMAKMLSPKEFKILFNIAVVLKILGKHDESEQYIKEAQANIIKGQEQKAAQLIQEFRQAKNGRLPLLK